ncbi:DELTA-sagatoxin-Srs1a-like [Morone saxatilis]|uniref:DELTA-sagatoxin-Srs1a-like n=1 Tax=Morone saxatilis TaxID=34816 RepID=UPI0015E1DEA2|nr:DELTA-sagatoxin-Srs1a-like [Morone saxatilis]
MAFAAVGAVSSVAPLIPTHRQCKVEIANGCSTYTLSNVSVYTKSGSGCVPPTIASGASGNGLFTKTQGAARGAVGVFTYDLLNTRTKNISEKIAVMYSVPYDFNLYSNWYALGIFPNYKECDYDLYCKMYYENDKTFVRGKAKGPSLTYKGHHVTIRATMSDSFQPIMMVQVSEN